MGRLTVVTWNSAGETRQTAGQLADALGALAELGHAADVIVVQGVCAEPGGPVFRMLAGLGHPYHPAPAHATEGGAEGSGGYLLLTRAGIDGQETFRRADLARDPGLRHWLDSLPAADRAEAHAQLAEMGMPATATLCVGASVVGLLTWRVPRGPGGANPEALLLYQHSALAAAANQRGIEIIAGDIGVTAEAFNTDICAGSLHCLLPGYGGVASGRQHIIGQRRDGRPDRRLPITAAECVPIAGHAHAVLCATATWPARRGAAGRDRPGPVVRCYRRR